MKNIIKFMKNNKLIFLSFFIPFFIVIIIFFMNDFFSKYICAQSDMQYQYISFLNNFKEIIKGNENIIYSFKKGLGGSMYGTFFYYMSSPLNLILLLFSKSNLNIGIAIIISIKLSLSGLTMYLYLKHKFKKESLMMLAFSSCYAISAYTIGYYFNIMWLDAVYLAPLLLIGIDKIIEKKDFKLYAIILFLDIFCNYYMAYITCIFAVLYFVYELLLKYNFKRDKKEIIKIIKVFIMSSFLIGLCCGFIILPVLNDLTKTAKTINDYNMITSLNLSFENIITKIYIGSQNADNILNRESINIYSSIIVFIMLLLYFVNKVIEKKERILSLVFLLLMLFPFFLPFLNLLWHGFNFPICFNYRYSFLFILFELLLCYKSYLNLDKVKTKYYVVSFIIFIILSIITILFYMSEKIISYYNIFLTLTYLILYLILLFLNKKGKIINKLIFLLIVTELFMNFYLSIKDYYHIYNQKYETYVNKEFINILPTDRDYRLEKTTYFGYNDSLLMDYNGVSSFDSTLNANIPKFLKKNGYYTESNLSLYSTPNLITDSILNVKYILYDQKLSDNYQMIGNIILPKLDDYYYGMLKQKYYLYNNKYSLSLGYMVDNNIKKFQCDKCNNYYEYSSKLLNTMVKSSNKYYEKYDIRKNNEIYKILGVKNIPIYYYIDLDYLSLDDKFILAKLDNIGNNTLTTKSGSIQYFYNNNNYDSIDIIFDKKVELKKFGFKKIYAWSYDEKLITDDLSKLKESQLNIIQKDDTYIKSNINVKESKTLFTSIPYEKEWNVYVDGKKVNKLKLLDTFIGIDLKKGNHIVEFKYKDKTILGGSIISVIGLLLMILYIKKGIMIDEKKR